MAARGSSKAPGTGITVTASRPTPRRSSSSSARRRSSPVSSPLKRATTIPTARRLPVGDLQLADRVLVQARELVLLGRDLLLFLGLDVGVGLGLRLGLRLVVCR